MRQSDSSQALAARELARVARASGCRVLSESTLVDGDRIWPVFRLECGDNAHAIRFLDRAATLDAGDAGVRDLALRLRRAHPSPVDFAHAVQRFIQSAVRFVREPRETFQHALYTLRRRAGDCDDHARAVTAIARAGGLRARVVGVANTHGQIAHVAPLLFDGGRWHWAETTVAARFGEHPRLAAKRLGLTHARPDLWADRRTTPRADSARGLSTTNDTKGE